MVRKKENKNTKSMSFSISSYKNIGITVQFSTLSVAPKPRRKESEKLAAKGPAVHSRRPDLHSSEPETFVEILEESMCRTWNRPAHARRCFADPCHCDQW
jgi:hypothetical protein